MAFPGHYRLVQRFRGLGLGRYQPGRKSSHRSQKTGLGESLSRGSCRPALGVCWPTARGYAIDRRSLDTNATDDSTIASLSTLYVCFQGPFWGSNMRKLVGFALTGAFFLAACGQIEDRSAMIRPTVPNQQATAGVGDVVFDLRQRESLPNVTGHADIFGRTRDTGRITLRYAGAKDGRAYFVRNDVTIETNETTMSRSPMIIPTTQVSSMNGYVGNIPVSGTGTTTGTAILPPAPVSRIVSQTGGFVVSAPIGGTLPIEGHSMTVLTADERSVTYSVR